MFEKMSFATLNEREEFEKYKKLKGVYLYKQVYDILLDANGGDEVTYYETSSVIRYDKNLRDMLYIYLATVEEYLRALLCDKCDVSEECKPFKRHQVADLKKELFEKCESETSNLYFKLELDFSVLMGVCFEKGLVIADEQTRNQINDLRNRTMHHSLLLFGKAKKVSDLESHFASLERKLNALVQILPDEYKSGFATSIRKLNGVSDKPYLTRFYLEVDNGSKQICVKK